MIRAALLVVAAPPLAIATVSPAIHGVNAEREKVASWHVLTATVQRHGEGNAYVQRVKAELLARRVLAARLPGAHVG